MAQLGGGGQPGHVDLGAEEALLVIRSQRGERLAFEQLVQRTARWLYARIYLELNNPQQVEDLVQESYLRAWKKLDSLSDPKTFRGWLAVIAHGIVVDSIKRDGRKKRKGNAPSNGDAMQRLSEVPDAAPSPAESLEQSERRREMLEVLRSLPSEYQDVLSLRYLAGADYAAISKQLAISNGSLRGLLNRGMKMLRDKLTTDEHR